ncbi:ABC transporter ATP-binding protein [Methanofollis formosanus]|uniref:Nickel import system ATP-binding protein NikD n=1 Tax=Methanofollis formosanus TaxID=299308 RepID=A0A8G1A2H6_9EURY|nr:ABC transporter ATP-binding protein [Methanofollis formosanus]QYZ79360.1 ABC transporter ATP-binding protein [Methanofollis formosanus]
MNGTNGEGLTIHGLKVSFRSGQETVRAVNHIDLTVKNGERLGLIGETGCGKTVLGMAIMRLLEPDTLISGEILYNGTSILEAGTEEMRRIRGGEIAMVLQNSVTSLNPVVTVGRQIAEAVELHRDLSDDEARAEAIRLLDEVDIPDPKRRFNCYPHEFSGGMNERVMIAMALAGNPSFLIADEPTTGLDTTVKNRIIALLDDVSRERSMLFITHDLAAAARVCDRIAVMYCGEIVECGATEEVFSTPLHPYTRGLLRSMPQRGLHPIPGMSPSLLAVPPGCRFRDRCELGNERCMTDHPQLKEVRRDRYVRCIYHD